MHALTLLRRSLSYYARTHVPVVMAVSVAVGVLGGALVVGDSVRTSLRELFLSRLGRVDRVVSSTGFFREALAADLDRTLPGERAPKVAPVITLVGVVTNDQSGRRASRVKVYGVDDRFFDLQGTTNGAAASPVTREIVLSRDLTRELGASPGDAVLLRVEKPSPVSADTLHGKRDDGGRSLRLMLREGESGFSIVPEQGEPRSALVSLSRLQRDLDLEHEANALVVAAPEADRETLERGLRSAFALEDLGVRVRVLRERGVLSVESDSVLLRDAVAEAATRAAGTVGASTEPVLTYLANVIRSGEREIPYSLVAGTDRLAKGGLTLNAWARRELGAEVGDRVSLEFYLWRDEGRLETREDAFTLSRVVPLGGDFRDPDLAPRYPGITESPDLSDWDPPFPVDMKRVRPQDEAYWDEHRTTPKAFLPLARAQALWGSRYGKLTSIRVAPAPGESVESLRGRFEAALREALDPLENGMTVDPVRERGIAASRGATDFGEYFLYFSFFLVAAALLLTALSFELVVAERVRELGVLAAIGFTPGEARSLLLREGAVLAGFGSLLGLAVSWGYAELVFLGLATWWKDAVGTTLLRVHVGPAALGAGAAAGFLFALGTMAASLRTLRSRSVRELLSGVAEKVRPRAALRRTVSSVGAASALAGLLLLALGAFGAVGLVPSFFGAGVLLLTGLLCGQWTRLVKENLAVLEGRGWRAVARLGLRNARARPHRSLLSIALIAFATFILVSVDAFRRAPEDSVDSALANPHSGTGGFPLLAEAVVPIYYDPNSREGRDALNLLASPSTDRLLSDVRLFPFRLKPGDDASCLNLYAPSNPRILAPTRDFVALGRFAFRDSLAETKGEKENPWLLLDRKEAGGEVPAIVDASSLEYVLHAKLGDTLVASGARLRVVASLADSVLQGEVVISQENFLRLFPAQGGYRFFLIDAPPGRAAEATEVLERRLADFGFDVTETAEKLAAFHRVENTYLSTFQALGALGLLLGTVGLGAILWRNVLERRRELALLRAVGYEAWHFAVLILAENAFLLCAGLLWGAVAAVVAILPALLSRGGGPPAAGLLLLVLATGLASSLVALVAALRLPLVASLKTE